jgi:hypothetical protein
MSHGDKIKSDTIRTQRRIGRLAQRDYDLSLKAISLDSGIPYPTVCSYFSQGDRELSELPVSALVKLIGVIPDELLSQLFDPADRHLAKNADSDDSCLDDLGDKADNVARLVRQARAPHSPGGTEIIAIEEEGIRRASRGLGTRVA